jgi:hypothetical protein
MQRMREADLNDIEKSQVIADFLEKAQAAYEADDSRSVSELCRKVVDLDPDNAQAWDLLAKFGGWDSKMFELDVDFAIDSAKHAIGLIPEENRYEAASEIYAARKRQIAKILESEMMMPSYTAAKQLQGTMMEWKRLLEEIPCLSVSLLEAEVALVNNLCLRSKLGIMPGDRLVHTAYMSLNGKESYGDTFRKALDGRLKREQRRQDERVALALESAKERLRSLDERISSGEVSSEEGKALVEGELAALQAEIAGISDQSNKVVYEQQLEELERQMAALKPFKIFKRQELASQIAATKGKIADVEADLERVLVPLNQQVEALRLYRDTLG